MSVLQEAQQHAPSLHRKLGLRPQQETSLFRVGCGVLCRSALVGMQLAASATKAHAKLTRRAILASGRSTREWEKLEGFSKLSSCASHGDFRGFLYGVSMGFRALWQNRALF